ncbi:MAG: serine/threonine protein kinase [Proteobacteria bacterium]|nr:serine/threonine protein kinase [Pseudomonadota bacterium]MBU1687568.1 serine/threonine protein kinase [Pseudomonadota bacterium]
MNRRQEIDPTTVFSSLTPEVVINAVEKGLGIRCTNLCRPLNSYINRVYELQTDDGKGVIVKFYRPGRWTPAALKDEHDFLTELAELEIPVIAPYDFKDGRTLQRLGDISFAVFPKKGGRSFDEYNEDQWLELGRLLARVHSVGEGRRAKARLTLLPDRATRTHLDYILQGDFIPAGLTKKFKQLTDELLIEITPRFQGIEMIRIHGDCHFSNLIHRPGESFYLIDFDDMVMGPPIHDLWMLLPGYLSESFTEVENFLEGYETFRRFDRRTLKLIEPLRAMRYIHFMAWCAHQVVDDGITRVTTDFGSYEYWEREIRDLEEQLDRIRNPPELNGNIL